MMIGASCIPDSWNVNEIINSNVLEAIWLYIDKQSPWFSKLIFFSTNLFDNILVLLHKSNLRGFPDEDAIILLISNTKVISEKYKLHDKAFWLSSLSEVSES